MIRGRSGGRHAAVWVWTILSALGAAPEVHGAEWRDAEWGMPRGDVVARYGVKTTRNPDIYAVAAERIAGVPFDVSLVLSGVPPQLNEVDLVSYVLWTRLREREFRELMASLSTRYGSPVVADTPDIVMTDTQAPPYVARKVVWESAGTTVTLTHLFGTVLVNSLSGLDILRISYRAGGPEPRKSGVP